VSISDPRQATPALRLSSPRPPSPTLYDMPDLLLREACHLEVLIPARDEEKRLPRTLAETVRYLESQPYSSSVVVIDNGSVDQTADLVALTRSDRVPVHLTGCAQPGKGAAVRRGLLTSRAHFVGYMDADLATPIDTLDEVLPLLRDWKAVVGSRRATGAVLAVRQPMHRRIGGMFFRLIAKQLLPGFADTQCGFKFFHGDLIREVARHLRIDGFAFDVELLHALVELGVPIKEIPVTWSNGEGSKLRSATDGVQSTMDLILFARARQV